MYDDSKLFRPSNIKLPYRASTIKSKRDTSLPRDLYEALHAGNKKRRHTKRRRDTKRRR